ncbi:acetyl-CoA carboxylase biotin carboxylase subunit [Thermus thermophilus]|uniref:Biotin carboxylase n=1 Tax=Thermus thermophilus TaxID=274 RepID=A0AAD1KU99_THETH|nr:acetyl-CoA carboxylase biotin carboxylase subunit [Thermus thermophilus]BBL82360.1 acetyl-CoA carboxylase biotin carboxylase subunit [Thermus thermophilus]BBL84662.1 acetyl-CoA carboxylase biotin carboxylase subunit [Thermus thermophilus]BCZ87020.1 acetyl-CoA carboxylase biotin carboxylase subunit [Thermus thermophilus]BCZ89396.1 acetyl-CoA carboxylase biotin carboxylase subunit [Thermus thermophilus]BCZ92037.1 acetyl-CoA carboxylase biotin carboxylase subunit [Thermus thermophilus]
MKKVLIANRGEIALRIIRAARELGIKTVVAHSTADEKSLPVLLADEAICIGPPPSGQSYLNIPNILSAAIVTGADAIHPGYGFLAENATFAEMCREHGITFIGPTPENMKALGDKATARKVAREAGVPTVPGTDELSSVEEAKRAAQEIGYPVILKASAGGGGRGMRVVHTEEELERAVLQAQEEARAAFGNPAVYLEKYIEEPKHIEIQVLGDGERVVHLWERDCSIQRRHQKLLEEAPSLLPEETRRAIAEAARRLAEHVGYVSAGTMEFLVDKEGNFYFIEMNTRIQVEHPVTEMITGIDLVQAQFRIAQGEKLWLKQEKIQVRGHAIEVRVNAEDPEKGFRPSIGKVETLLFPGGPGVRVDSHLYTGYQIPPHYDSLIAKIIVWAPTREEAIRRMERALSETVIEGPGLKTTIPFHQKVLQNAFFRRGAVYTNFVARRMEM